MAFNLSGNCGVAGATVSWSGTSSGSVVADGSGNYSATGVLTSGGNYTVTPSLAGYNFAPASSYWPNVSFNLTGITFTAAAIPNAQIVQTAVQVNTTGGDTATATFGKNLTAGNGLIVAVMAVDTGGAIATDAIGSSSAAASYAAVSDSQSNSFATIGNGISITADRTHGKTFLVGIYYVEVSSLSGGVKGAADAVTFTFTPISSSSNCVVGVVAFEVAGFFKSNFSLCTPSDTASTVPTADGGQGTVYVYPGTFPPVVNGNITIAGNTYGMFNIACAAATTSDGSTFTVGSKTAGPFLGEGAVGELGWVLAASLAAYVNGTYVTLAVQTEFCTGEAENNPCTFGNTPSTTGVASVAAAMGFPIGNTPGGATDTYDPTKPFLGSVTVVAGIPAGENDVFQGTVKVLASAPPGENNPYLGHVNVLSAAPSGRWNPSLGQVVVLSSRPNNTAPDIWFGSVVES